MKKISERCMQFADFSCGLSDALFLGTLDVFLLAIDKTFEHIPFFGNAEVVFNIGYRDNT